MTHAWVVALCALVLSACAGAQPSPACSDKTYAALVAECASAAVGCRQSGGSEAECGTVCDAKAEDWAKRCGQ